MFCMDNFIFMVIPKLESALGLAAQMLLQGSFGCDSCGSPVITQHSSFQQRCGPLLILSLPCI